MRKLKFFLIATLIYSIHVYRMSIIIDIIHKSMRYTMAIIFNTTRGQKTMILAILL